MSEQIANNCGVVLFEGNIRLTSVARLSHSSEVSHQAIAFSSVSLLMVVFIL